MPLALGAGLLLLGAALFCARGLQTAARLRVVQDTPTSRVRSAAQGYLELCGRAALMPGPPIRSALAQVPCVWWRCEVWQRTDQGNREGWERIRAETSDDLFLLRDETGACIVDAEGAQVTPTRKSTWTGNRAQFVPEAGEVVRYGGNYRYSEEYIFEGDPLYALGWFRTQGALPSTSDEGDDVRALLAEWKRDKQKMAEFDLNRDGVIDLQEWEAARRAALAQVRQENLDRALDPDLHVLCRPPDRRAYVLVSGTQKTVVRGLHRKLTLWFSAAGALAIAAIWLLVHAGHA